MGITELADMVRAGLDRLERLAKDADTMYPWTAASSSYGPSVRIGEYDDLWSREGQGVDAAYRCDDPHDTCADARASYEAEAALIAQCADPAAVLRDVAAKRQLLDQALGWEHYEVDDPWFSCCAAPNAPAEHRGQPCTCGRDERVLAVLQALTAPYQETTA